jgi:hypothetical protein
MDRGADRKTKVKSKLNLKLYIIKTKRKVNALITYYWIAFLDVNSIYCERLIAFDCDCWFDSDLTEFPRSI